MPLTHDQALDRATRFVDVILADAGPAAETVAVALAVAHQILERLGHDTTEMLCVDDLLSEATGRVG